jgi:MFS family permease
MAGANIPPSSTDLSNKSSTSDLEQQAYTDKDASQVYRGSGTREDPYVVEFLPNDPTNPLNFSMPRKCGFTFIVTMSVFAITMTSSAYAGSGNEIRAAFAISGELYAAGVSLFVLGFAVGPSLWAPLSEMYGRRVLFIATHAGAVAFIAGAAGADSLAALLVCRFLGGTLGAAPLTNSGGVIADVFPAAVRGLAMGLFSSAPFLGPVLGPIVGGFVSMSVGWRWVQGVMAITVGVFGVLGAFVVPETYGPVLLRQKATRLSRETGRVYVSVLERERGSTNAREVFGRALKRPWALLFREPIVLIASTYLSILYGTVYMLFGAFPIVYQELRGWNEGVGGLAFLGLMVGMMAAFVYNVVDQARYGKDGSQQPPEARLPAAVVGAVALPIGMFGFAWTNQPSIHWSASIIFSAIFGFGMVLVFVAILNYLIDAYTIYAASVLGATAMQRALFGSAFPLFTSQMYHRLGIHWASSIPAFLALICVPFPILMYRYGAQVRMKCKYAKEAAILLAQMQSQK